MAWDSKWDDVYKEGWGAAWPDEHLIRFMETTFKDVDRSHIRVLDAGCGNGRNLRYLIMAGFDALGIEASEEVRKHSLVMPEYIIKGDMTDMKIFDSNLFDVVVDICSLQHNSTEDTKKIASEIYRVLKPGGYVFSILRSTYDSLYCEGKRLEPMVYDSIPEDLEGKGITQFFNDRSIKNLFKDYNIISIDYENRSLNNTRKRISHYIVIAEKPIIVHEKGLPEKEKILA